jgi:hypothetical protein
VFFRLITSPLHAGAVGSLVGLLRCVARRTALGFTARANEKDKNPSAAPSSSPSQQLQAWGASSLQLGLCSSISRRRSVLGRPSGFTASRPHYRSLSRIESLLELQHPLHLNNIEPDELLLLLTFYNRASRQQHGQSCFCWLSARRPSTTILTPGPLRPSNAPSCRRARVT